MLPAGAALGLLAADRREGVEHRIEHRNRVDGAAPALPLELTTNGRVDDGVQDKARPPLDIVEHALEMAFGPNHRPRMADRLDIVELGEAGIGDHVERLAGRIRQEMNMETLHRAERPRGANLGLWKTMGKSLAEACGEPQGRDSPTSTR
jgi:hypothetical protein